MNTNENNSGTLKFYNPAVKEETRKWKFENEGVYETINEAIGNGASYSFANIKFNGASDYVAKYRDLIASAPDLLKENQELQKELADTQINLSTVEALNAELLEALHKLLMAAEYSMYIRKSSRLDKSMKVAKVLINKAKS